MVNKLADITDYEKIKDMLRVRLINKDNNQAYYKMGPYRKHPMGVEVLYIELERNQEGSMHIHVTNTIAEQWMIPKTELLNTALKNTQSNLKAKFSSMDEVINEIMSDEGIEIQETSPMYVLSNEAKEYGATVMLYPDVLKQVRSQLGEDFYILPSSVHESIILPKTKIKLDVKELRDMVREINRSQVMPEEVLGNEVYEFRGSTNKVRKCVKEDRER